MKRSLFFPSAIPFPALMQYQMDNLFYVCGEFQIFYLNNYHPRDFEAISVKYINKLTPRLIFPAFNIGIFFEYFLIICPLFE